MEERNERQERGGFKKRYNTKKKNNRNNNEHNQHGDHGKNLANGGYTNRFQKSKNRSNNNQSNGKNRNNQNNQKENRNNHENHNQEQLNRSNQAVASTRTNYHTPKPNKANTNRKENNRVGSKDFYKKNAMATKVQKQEHHSTSREQQESYNIYEAKERQRDKKVKEVLRAQEKQYREIEQKKNAGYIPDTGKDAIRKFEIGQHELEGKKFAFTFDCGTYRILERKGSEEERKDTELLNTRDKIAAYQKWNEMKRPKKGRGLRLPEDKKEEMNE